MSEVVINSSSTKSSNTKEEHKFFKALYRFLGPSFNHIPDEPP